MQEERASLGYLSEALNFEHGSTSNGLITDHQWDNIHSLGDNDLHDYMIANSEPVYQEQLGEASSSGTKNEVIDLDSDSEQPSAPNQHVQNDVNLNAEYIELDEEYINPARDGAGSSVEGRKRKALQGSIGQSSSGGYGESSNSVNGLNISSGPRGHVSGSSSRNTGLRSNPSDQQEHMSDLRLGQSLGNVFTQNSNPPPPFQWTEVSLAGESSTSTAPVSRSIPESPLFIPPPELRNVSLSQSSRNETSGNLNIASSVSTTGVQPTHLAYQNLLHQQRRRSSLISSTNQRVSLPPDGLGTGDNNNSQTPYSRAAGQWLDRQQGDSVAPHDSFRALAAAASRGRSRLTVSQMQNILDVMRRDPNHNLRLEDVMLLNQSLLLDGAANDRYRDMRLDVDNMSYEELLALEERIGDVCTGVNEETITNQLKQRKYKSSIKSPQDAEPSCCICQEEYSKGEDMGTLECGHDFHSQCIKEWLKQKNLCPICKTTGLNTAKKRKIGCE